MLTAEYILNLSKICDNKKITILGHDNIDVDSFLSGVLLSKFLDFIGIENEFLILEEIKENDTYNIVKELFGIDMKKYQKIGESKERYLFLVDHYETMHDGTVVAIIDHHPNSKKSICNFNYVRKSCATSFMIYELMQLVNYPFSSEEIKMIVVSMIIDTVSFKSTKTVQQEAEIAKKIADKYEIDFKFLLNYGLRITDISKMTDEEIISNGEKWYSFKRKNDVISSYIQLYEMPNEAIRDKWIYLIRAKIQKIKTNMAVFIIYDMAKNETHEYHISENKTCYIWHHEILSRGNDIMPKVELRYLT